MKTNDTVGQMPKWSTVRMVIGVMDVGELSEKEIVIRFTKTAYQRNGVK